MNPHSEKDDKKSPILENKKEEKESMLTKGEEKFTPPSSKNFEKKEEEMKKFKMEYKEDPAKNKLSLRDGILTLIGNQLHHILFGCVMVIFNLNTYLMSYLRHYQEKKTITLQYNYFIGPIMSITMGLFTPTVGVIENKLGLKLSIILGDLLTLWFTVILYFSKNYYFDLFAFFVNSLGSSMGALMSRNLMGYFFHVRGKLTGLLSVIGSLVSSGYNIIGEKTIVNPNSEEAVVDHAYYSFEVCKNLLKYYRFCWFCIVIGTTLAVIFIVPFDKRKHVHLFKPKGLKGFDKEKFKNFSTKKNMPNKDVKIDDKIGPLIPEDEKIVENKNEIKIAPEVKIEDNKKKGIKEDENINIDNEKEIEEEKRDIVKELSKKKVKSKKNDFSKTTSVPAILVTNKDIILNNPEIVGNPGDIEEKNKPTIRSKRSLSVPFKKYAPKFPLINIIPDMEVVAIAPAPSSKPTRKKFNIKFIKQALKSRRVLFLFLMGLFSAPLSNFLMSTWRPIGIRKGVPTRYLQNIGTYRPFITCAATLIFSTLSDYVPFRYLYFIFSILSTFVGVTFCFTFKNPAFFTFIILLNSVIFSGKMSITGPHYMKVFGLRYYIEIGGVIGLSRVFMSPLCTIFIFLFETYIAAPEGKQVSDIPYIILFTVTGFLNAIAAVLSLFETEELFTP
jgi:MFS family permease